MTTKATEKSTVKKVSLTIDGRSIEVVEGTTILHAAKVLGIEIPTLCYDFRLSNAGACRMCVVEVEGAKTLTVSCSTAATEGMNVKTNSNRVIKARKMVLELLWSDHPNDCLTCNKTGNCGLQDLMYQYDVKDSRFRDETKYTPPEMEGGAIYRDMDKCIRCGKCIRICDEVQCQHILSFSKRGFKTTVATAFNEPMKESGCVFCGHCVSVCPTGALNESAYFGKVRSWETKKVNTVCTYCGVGCSIDVHVTDSKIVKVTADIKSPPNYGSLCVKGRFGFDFHNHPDRLKTPLVRDSVDQPFREASWDETISLVAKKFQEIKDKYGPDSFGVLCSSRGTNEENFLGQKFSRAVMGTNNVDNCARVCHAPSVTGLRAALGSGAATNSLDDIEGAKVLLICGSNTTEAHPVAALKVKKALNKNGAKLILIDPREIELADYATVWLRIKPGTNIAIINGLLHVIIKEGLENKEFVENRTENIEMLKPVVAHYTPEKTEEITGVPKDKIIEAARLYASTNKGMILYGLGVTEHKNGSHGVMSLANLALLTGNIGRPNTGINPLRGQNNVQGSCDMGALPNVYTCYQAVDDEEANAKFSEAWGTKLPSKPGYKEPEMYRAADEGKLKGMYIIGYDPAATHSNVNFVSEALKKLDFLVVQELFHTETTKIAHVVLPAGCFFEKEGTFTNAERRIRKLNEVIPLPDGVKNDWDITCKIAQAMGYKHMEYNGPSDIMDEIARLTPQFKGISFKRLEGDGLVWPVWDENHPGTPILHTETFTRGRGLFNDVAYTPSEELPDDEYPLMLTTGRILYHHNNGSMTLKCSNINFITANGFAEIHPDDASKLGIEDGETIKVLSRRGEVNTKTVVTKRSLPGTVFMPFHYSDTITNKLTGPGEDILALTPEYKVCAIKIEK